MAHQTSFLPNEDALKKLCHERSELRSKVKPLLDLVKGNAQFLVKYSPFCADVFFRSNHLVAARENTSIAMEQADELANATLKLSGVLSRYAIVESEIERLKEELNTATEGEHERQHPELYGTSTEQLDAKADEILESEGVDAETGAVAEEEQDESRFEDGRGEDIRTAV